VLVARLAALAEAVARMRESQQRATQAASALSAARCLQAAARTGAAPGERLMAGTAAGLAGAGFPVAPGPGPSVPAAPTPPRGSPPVARPSPGQRR
jgi:hypothetical protein